MHTSLREYRASLTGSDIAGTQMHTVSAGSDGNIATRVQEKPWTRSRNRANDFCRLNGKGFQVAHWQILFTKLDEIHSGFSRQTNLRDYAAPASGFRVAKLLSVGYVVEEQGFKISRGHDA